VFWDRRDAGNAKAVCMLQTNIFCGLSAFAVKENL